MTDVRVSAPNGVECVSMGERRKTTSDTPSDLAQRIGDRSRARAREQGSSLWRRETYTLPRPEARNKAQEWFAKFPKAAYMTEIEFWRELSDGQIEFTIRRLPTAD